MRRYRSEHREPDDGGPVNPDDNLRGKRAVIMAAEQPARHSPGAAGVAVRVEGLQQFGHNTDS